MILHFLTPSPIVSDYLKYINSKFNLSNQRFVILASNLKESDYSGIVITSSPKNFFKIFYYMLVAKKIIVHGFFSAKFKAFLFLNSYLIKKIYWILWGNDCYIYIFDCPVGIKENINFYFTNQVLQKVKNIITYIPGDFEIASQHFKMKAQLTSSFVYPSNLYRDLELNLEKEQVFNIMVGHSASPEGRHIEILNKLILYKNDNIKIICPLSYGDKKYRDVVIDKGKALFGEKFYPILNFMPLNEYSKILSSLDIAIFNLDRQEGMGNIIKILGMGKKLYLSDTTSVWPFLNDLGIKVYSVKNLTNLLDINSNILDKNIYIIKNYFSEKNLIEQNKKILDL